MPPVSSRTTSKSTPARISAFGFGELFRAVSLKSVGVSALQSRATGGVANGTYLFALPGSPGACKDAWDEILVLQLDRRYRPCNFVELMPRLMEK
jgi:molybdenum cofactor biosynthesis protein B